MDAMVDVIVPVYRGAAETRRCVESVLAAPQETAFELIIIDDASPEPELSTWVESLRGHVHVTVIRNAANLGFVATVNLGMAMHPERDVVLLNSDTMVANDWLDRLRSCAYSDASIGTVTPFSNNATLCSYPWNCRDNALPAGMSLADVDACIRQANAGGYVEIPTAVGFCMYIRRACIDRIGLFDVARFPRGYGEENDFSRRAVAAGWKNVLCADTYVFHEGGVSFRDERDELMHAGGAALESLYPDYPELIQAHLHEDPAASYRRAAQASIARFRANARGEALEDAGHDGPIVQMHVLHELGGGIAHWCRDFVDADPERINLVLKPITHSHDFGEGLALYDSVDATYPIWMRLFDEPIRATAARHAEYASAVRDLITEYHVDSILVSSLIGHALDILETGLPTLVVQHDFFPLCPAINAYFGALCRHCDKERLTNCTANNPDFNPFHSFTPDERHLVRERYLEIVRQRAIPIIVPTDSVAERLMMIAPGMGHTSLVSIPHGYPARYHALPEHGVPAEGAERVGGARLRIVVLGMLAASKGVHLLRQVLDELTGFADIHLVGAREVGEIFLGLPGVHVIERYRPEDLQAILEHIRPDVGLLMSICHETFSYTLSELFEFAIPPVATRVGSFAERIRHGANGFLYEPDAASMLACLRALDGDRVALSRVRRRLEGVRHRLPREMVDDYHRLLPAHASRHAAATAGRSIIPLVNRQAAELSGFWREVKSLRLSLQMKDIRLGRQAEQLARVQWALDMQAAAVRDAETTVARLTSEIAELRASTSWRWSVPIRWAGTVLRKSRTLARYIAPLMREPGAIPRTALTWLKAFRTGGYAAMKAAIVSPLISPVTSMKPSASVKTDPDWRQAEWEAYLRCRTEQVWLDFGRRIESMDSPPLISIIVPVYNPKAEMLEAMLDSVLEQIYPHWEACIADDASSQRHVATILKRYAKRDSRIRLDFSEVNRGVSHASNRALNMAQGQFVVLLDHDDLLEPQALFRVAEAVCGEDPDMCYSDELLVGEDGGTVQHFIFRPMFSPEYLRSHPYIVHLVGFRTELLRRLGGFDENLRISQDYDLILRVTEQARSIVHIPEILYRWRIHESSSGHARMHEVMETSKSVLCRHLDRCGKAGEVNDGPSFNFFDTRYPLGQGAHVAIIIPTHNHPELVRACIESIERTVHHAACDIVLVDHASDDPDALAYFEALAGRAAVIRYEGPFNFSALNNWAVRQIDQTYTHYLFCNNDVEAIQDGWLERMLELCQQEEVGMVGAKLFYPDRTTIQHAGVVVGCCGVAENLGRYRHTTDGVVDTGYIGSLVVNREVSAVTAACMLVKSEVFHAIGGFDENLVVGFGDVDLCLSAAVRGYSVLLCGHAELLHHESKTRGHSDVDPHPEDSHRFSEKWRSTLISGDPYYNPNLSVVHPDWRVGVPLTMKSELSRRLWLSKSAHAHPAQAGR